MGLTSSMWAGVSGLLAQSSQLNLIGNNLANVDTVGYKAQVMDFEDMVYASVPTASGLGQIGLGVRTGSIYSDFSQGPSQTTDTSTDMEINGAGFFQVRDQTTNETYYTRAGNFSFDANGYLINPNDLRVQGWAVNTTALRAQETQGTFNGVVPVTGAQTDIKVDALNLAAQATSSMTVITNLNRSDSSHSTGTANPFFNMFEDYNYNPQQPSTAALSSNDYDYSQTLTVYDQRGGAHSVSVYYDKVSDVGGKEYWEYMVASNPSEDGRTFNINGTQTAMDSNAKAGVLQMGTMVFGANGNLQNITAYSLNSNSFVNGVSNLSDWTLSKISSTGYPTFTANFLGVSNASYVGSSNAQSISLNLGIKSANSSWNTGAAANAAAVGLSQLSNAAALQGFNPNTLTVSSLATTNYVSTDTALRLSQDGYPPGSLQSVSVDANGVIIGTYTNGQSQDLWVVALADFSSPLGLQRDGSNLFSATPASGQPLVGRANSGQLGGIIGSALEGSNVDMATEMVNMIVDQRDYEANSKTITTADTMISEVIQLKR